MSAAAFYRYFFGLKWTQARNHLSQLRRHLWVHFIVGLGVVAILIGGGALLFGYVFDYLMSPENRAFGVALMDQLLKMVLLAFFSMLIFSNLIIMLTTTYISREVEFLMSQPIPHRRLFFGKLGESMIYSSWAFVILAIPFFVALGHARRLDLPYYVGAAAMIAPYVIIPAALGAALALLLAAYFPPRRMVRLAFAMALLGVLFALAMQRSYGISQLLRSGGAQDRAA